MPAPHSCARSPSGSCTSSWTGSRGRCTAVTCTGTGSDHHDAAGVDAYTTGGLSYGDGPTAAFDDWDIVFEDDRFRRGRPHHLWKASP
jgi:hypothetical protein